MIARRRALATLLGALLFAVLAASDLAAGEPKEYAYLFLQGKLSNASGRRPLIDARVRLSGDQRSFDVRTDESGVFRFDRLPVGTYELEITTVDGRTVRAARRIDLNESDRNMFRVRIGRGKGVRLSVAPASPNVSVSAPDPPTKWGRLGKQFAIFVGAAAALAL